VADVRLLWSSRSAGARLVRGALLPAATAFRGVTLIRNALYNAGFLKSVPLGAPAVSVGNLTAGGTGKTPVAHWIAAELGRRGAHPAILLRGYGGDETLVHERLRPGGIVVAHESRVYGASGAIQLGADVLVLDDAFQHRRAARDADVVLISADAIGSAPWPLPAGPWRDPLRAAARADLIVVTRKAADDAAVQRAVEQVANAAPGKPTAVVRIAAAGLTAWRGGEGVSPKAVDGARVLAVSAIGDPDAFEGQLRQGGMTVISARFPDHYRFSPADAVQLGQKAAGFDRVVCTLKDAVKLGPLWPHDAPPLWYLSQRITVERGGESVTGLLDRLLALVSSKRAPPARRPTY
jgi:tetraacyldisaccharide 4'-kinase